MVSSAIIADHLGCILPKSASKQSCGQGGSIADPATCCTAGCEARGVCCYPGCPFSAAAAPSDASAAEADAEALRGAKAVAETSQ